ncbi:MAG: NADPH-dependent oxidoreductase [Bacteroidales bacterium]|nr:MAG: NADPH-dependent oxidoreductase [Bacteroidales bacterium]
MDILGIVGSARKTGTTKTLVERTLEAIQKENTGLTTEMLHISDYKIAPCSVSCSSHCTNKQYSCALNDDINLVLEKMKVAKGLVIGTPLYFRSPPAVFACFAERMISMSYYWEISGKDCKSALSDKPCILIGVAEYSNPQVMLEYLNDFCMILKMKPVLLEKFPYFGIASHSKIIENSEFNTMESIDELARKITPLLL